MRMNSEDGSPKLSIPEVRVVSQRTVETSGAIPRGSRYQEHLFSSHCDNQNCFSRSR
jgi:hypothetical protein